jgi:hypothetical protein
MFIDPRQELMIETLKQSNVILVVLFHQLPRIRIFIHTTDPEFEGSTGLLTKTKLLRDKVQLVRSEPELILGYLQQIYLLVRGGWVKTSQYELLIKSRNIKGSSVEMNHYISIVQELVDLGEHHLLRALVDRGEVSMIFSQPLG